MAVCEQPVTVRVLRAGSAFPAAASVAALFTGRAALLAGNGILFLWLAFRLDPGAYGRVFAGVGSQLLFSRLLLLGSETGMIRLSADPGASVLKWRIAALAIVGIMTLATCIAGAGLSLTAAVSLSTVMVIIAGALGAALVDLEYSDRVARLNSGGAARFITTVAVTRLAIVCAVAEVAVATPAVILGSYAAPGLLAGGVGAFRALQKHTGSSFATVLRLARYSLPQGFANFAALLSFYQGAFFLTAAGLSVAADEFSFALTLSMGAFAMFQAYSEHLLPRAARAGDLKSLRGFLLRSLAGAAAIVAAAAPAMILAGWLAYALTKRDFAPLVYYPLLGSMLALILQTPFHAAAHYFLKPQIILAAWIVRVAGMGAAVAALKANTAAAVAFAQCVAAGATLIFAGAVIWFEVHKRYARRAMA